MTNVAINGLGRIGRCVLRALFEEKKYSNFNLVAVNASAPLETLRHILKYDSVHGQFNKDIEISKDDHCLIIDGKKVKVVAQRNPELLPWTDLNIHTVFECTGQLYWFQRLGHIFQLL